MSIFGCASDEQLKDELDDSIQCFTSFMDSALEADSESDFESILNSFISQGARSLTCLIQQTKNM